MARDDYADLLRAATPELGYKSVAAPAAHPVDDTATVKQALLQFAHGVPAADYLESAVQHLVKESWLVTDLRDAIEKLGVRPQGRTRVDLSRQLVTLFYDPGRLELVFRALDEETQAFYAQLLLNLELNPWGREREGWPFLRPLSQPLPTFMHRIADVGLAFERGPGQLYIPPFLLRNLPPIYVPAESLMAEPPQRVEPARPAYTVIQIQQFLGFVGTRAMQLRPVRQWLSPEPWQRLTIYDVIPTPATARALRRLRQGEGLVVEILPPEPTLEAADLEALSQSLALPAALVETLYHSLIALGVLRQGSPVQLEPALLEAFVGLEPGEQLTAMVRTLLFLPAWGPCWQLWRELCVHLQWHYRPYWGRAPFGQIMTQAFEALNYVVFRYLALLPHELWLAPGPVVDFLLKFIPKSEVLSPYRMLQFSDMRGSWEGFLRLYLEALLTGPLHWLGLCDVGYDTRGTLTAFRLYHLQNVIWERANALSLPPTVWQGDGHAHWAWKAEQLLLRPPVPAAVMQLLQQWAEPAGIEGDWLVYRPNVQRLHTAFESGETFDTLRERWLQSAGAAPPLELLQWWEQWYQRYGHIRLYPHQALLLAADALTLKEVQLAAPELREGLLGLIDSKTALLRSEKVDSLLQQLTARGYMPKELQPARSQRGALPEDSEVK
ncbi:MAG: hypothetical protein JW892_17015 [Anaerolineae bacterium]|nr:hypothetical protein [Anaerolineae bacterium]